MVRLGIRSFGWLETELPARGGVTFDLQDFTVENDGAVRPEDWNKKHIEKKRGEKYYTAKVRFFVDGKMWAPRVGSRGNYE